MTQLTDIILYCLATLGPALSDYNKRLILFYLINYATGNELLKMNKHEHYEHLFKSQYRAYFLSFHSDV